MLSEIEPHHHEEIRLQRADKILYASGIVQMISTAPQVYQAIVGNVQGLSLITWTMWVLTTLGMLYYAVVHKRKPLIFLNTAWVFINGSIALAILIHR